MVISSSTCPSGDERVALFGLLLETNARLSRDLASTLERSCQLPLAWFEVLLQLHHSADGRLTMSQMADAVFHSTGGTTRLVDRLEEAGFVERAHCSNDRRTVWVAITNAGRAKLDEALGVHLGYLDELFGSRLAPDERAELSSLLTKLNA